MDERQRQQFSAKRPDNGDGDDRNRRLSRLPRRPDPGGEEPQGRFGFKRSSRTVLFWVALIVLSVVIIQAYNFSGTSQIEINLTELYAYLDNGNVSRATVTQRSVTGEFVEEVADKSGTRGSRAKTFKEFRTKLPPSGESIDKLIARLESAGVTITIDEEGPNWTSVLLNFAPWVLILLLFWLFMFRQMQSGPKGIFSFGKSRARLVAEDKQRVTFADVAGADEAKTELQEVIDFLKDPGKFQKLGGKIPKGVLLLGPPGTGKTLLARAVAGEAGVPFFSMSGSDFVEMFVGVGASRVRDLFEQGKRNAPCILFIDEIDAVGRQRGAGLGGGHDEREQTLNQLLVEMDGFESNDGVILLAATNRPDVLDPAILRPGRFDRQVVVDSPDVKGREGIFKVHGKNIRVDSKVNLEVLARGTPGLSGADIANLVNEAALLAARRNREAVQMSDFEDARDKVMMGSERRSLVITEDEKKTTAYHEAGHALVGKLTPEADPIHKVTIIPRGLALGVTHFLPIDEKHTHSREYLEARLIYTMGGRVAEKLMFDRYTTGAGNDIKQATDIAHKMICEWGMSEKLGPLSFAKKQEEIFLGREIAQHRDYSEETARLIDSEVHALVINAEKKATDLLTKHRDELTVIAEALLEREILTGEEIDILMRGEALPERERVESEYPEIQKTQDADAKTAAGEKDKPEGDVLGAPAVARNMRTAPQNPTASPGAAAE